MNLPDGNIDWVNTEGDLRTAKFSNVSTITLFIPASQGEETTRIYYIGFLGSWTEVCIHGFDRLCITDKLLGKAPTHYLSVRSASKSCRPREDPRYGRYMECPRPLSKGLSQIKLYWLMLHLSGLYKFRASELEKSNVNLDKPKKI